LSGLWYANAHFFNILSLFKLKTMHGHQFKTLLEAENGYIGICEMCNTYSIAYKNMLWNLEATEVDWFEDVLKKRRFMDRFTTTHGKDLLHATPINNFFILFNDTEIKELLSMIKKVRLIIDARKGFEWVN
jgi:hypothetical protein